MDNSGAESLGRWGWPLSSLQNHGLVLGLVLVREHPLRADGDMELDVVVAVSSGAHALSTSGTQVIKRSGREARAF